MRVSGLLVMRDPRIVRGFRQIGARGVAVLLLPPLAALERMEVAIVLSMLVSVETAASAATVVVAAVASWRAAGMPPLRPAVICPCSR